MSLSDTEQESIVAIALGALGLAVKLAPMLLTKKLATSAAWKTLMDDVKAASGDTETDLAKREAERNARG